MYYDEYTNQATYEASLIVDAIYDLEGKKCVEITSDIVRDVERYIDENTTEELAEDILSCCVAKRIPYFTKEIEAEYYKEFEMQLKSMSYLEIFTLGTKYGSQQINFRELAVSILSELCATLAISQNKICIGNYSELAAEKMAKKYNINIEDISFKDLFFDDCLIRNIYNQITNILPRVYREKMRAVVRESDNKNLEIKKIVTAITGFEMSGYYLWRFRRPFRLREYREKAYRVLYREYGFSR